MIRYPAMRSCDIYLPAKNVDMFRWPVIACDQFTSQPEYWKNVENTVGDAPSTLRIMRPEVYLSSGDDHERIVSTMKEYLDEGILVRRVEDGFVAVERSTQSGKRLGLICALDLECYEFSDGDHLIRATEETVIERLPARVRIRRDAPVEMPHVMMLIDDPEKTVIEPVLASVEDGDLLYDTDLMEGGGHLRGWSVTSDAQKRRISDALYALLEKSEGFLYAVGDGNHSLASAKQFWVEKKAGLSMDEAESDPARFALVELVNLHSDALNFEPVHRIVTGTSFQRIVDGFRAHLRSRGMDLTEGAEVRFVSSGKESGFSVAGRKGMLPVAVLQEFLDGFIADDPALTIDYIHGETDTRELCAAGDSVGMLLEPLDKFSLFPGIRAGGHLPRKTFSMGEAREKRYYMECRKIRR